jgi:hypothetical protein
MAILFVTNISGYGTSKAVKTRLSQKAKPQHPRYMTKPQTLNVSFQTLWQEEKKKNNHRS